MYTDPCAPLRVPGSGGRAIETRRWPQPRVEQLHKSRKMKALLLLALLAALGAAAQPPSNAGLAPTRAVTNGKTHYWQLTTGEPKGTMVRATGCCTAGGCAAAPASGAHGSCRGPGAAPCAVLQPLSVPQLIDSMFTARSTQLHGSGRAAPCPVVHL